jgi:tRNA(Ile)-lysidine synthase
MIKTIHKTLKRHSMLCKNDRLLLCVSGGPDSIAMAHAFCEIAKGTGIKLFIAHVNHSLRGIESDRDQIYVENTARRLGLPVIIKKADTLGFSKEHGLSIEDAARRLRYDFFVKAAKENKINVIATAHTRDDQVETVLMRVIRGAGLRGLRGILLERDIGDIRIIRPLIDVTRKQVTEYLVSQRCRPRSDKSNSDIRFFRNKVRLKLLPILERDYNPRIRSVLSNFAETANEDYEYLRINHKMIFDKLANRTRTGIVDIALPGLKRQHMSAKRGIVRNAIESLSSGLDNIDYRHWQEIDSLIDSRPSGSRVDLPNNIVAEKTKSSIRFFIARKKILHKALIASTISKIPGAEYFGRYIVKADIVERRPVFTNKPRNTEYLDIKDKDLPLKLRVCSDGDRMRPLGMKNYKKLSDIFIDEKIPAGKRKSIPIILSSKNEILCVFGVRVSDTCKISKHTKRTVRLQLLTR